MRPYVVEIRLTVPVVADGVRWAREVARAAVDEEADNATCEVREPTTLDLARMGEALPWGQVGPDKTLSQWVLDTAGGGT